MPAMIIVCVVCVCVWLRMKNNIYAICRRVRSAGAPTFLRFFYICVCVVRIIIAHITREGSALFVTHAIRKCCEFEEYGGGNIHITTFVIF
jgi:hypothetical protein